MPRAQSRRLPEPHTAVVVFPARCCCARRTSVQRGAIVRRAVEAAGYRLLSLSPYSANLNPVERGWSDMMSLLRLAGSFVVTSVHNELAGAVGAITPDARGYF